MAGETDLGRLLRDLDPVVRPGRYVFASVRGGVPAGVVPAATVVEDEGLSLVLDEEAARAAGLHGDHVAGWITLRVHSALEAVGLTAAVAGALAGAGISANVIAGTFHDHVLVPHAAVDRALAVLAALRDAPPG